MLSSKENWYTVVNGKVVIELSVDDLEQLFDHRDPNPFRIKDLDDDVVEYIVSIAQEVGSSKVGKLVITSPDRADDKTMMIITNAFRDFFYYQIDLTSSKIMFTLKKGFKALIIGLVFLSFAVFFSHSLGRMLPDTFLKGIFEEGLLLLGWVSMWNPVNTFLYEWWPDRDMIRIYRRLTEIDLVFKHAEMTDLIPD